MLATIKKISVRGHTKPVGYRVFDKIRDLHQPYEIPISYFAHAFDV
jgi:hypothetical protein